MPDLSQLHLPTEQLEKDVRRAREALKSIGVAADKTEKKVDDVGRKSKKSAKGLSSLGKAAKVAFGALAAIGALSIGASLIRGLDRSVDLWHEQANAIAQVEQGLRSTAGVSGLTLGELQKIASELQAATGIGDEAILRVQSQLLTFTNISAEVFGEVTERILDLSVRMEGDIKGATVGLAKALNDPIANLSALSRQGIQFTDVQKEMIKGLVESGRQLDAQRIILAELETQFGGSARAAADLDFKRYAAATGDFSEQVGRLVSGPLSDLAGAVTPIVQSMETWLKGINDIIDGFGGLSTAWALTVGHWADGMLRILTPFSALQQNLRGVVNDMRRAIGLEGIDFSQQQNQLDEMVTTLFEIRTEMGLFAGKALFDKLKSGAEGTREATDDLGGSVRELGTAYSTMIAQAEKQGRILELMQQTGLSAAAAAKAVDLIFSKDRGGETKQQIVDLVREISAGEQAAKDFEEALSDAIDRVESLQVDIALDFGADDAELRAWYEGFGLLEELGLSSADAAAAVASEVDGVVQSMDSWRSTVMELLPLHEQIAIVTAEVNKIAEEQNLSAEHRNALLMKHLADLPGVRQEIERQQAAIQETADAQLEMVSLFGNALGQMFEDESEGFKKLFDLALNLFMDFLQQKILANATANATMAASNAVTGAVSGGGGGGGFSMQGIPAGAFSSLGGSGGSSGAAGAGGASTMSAAGALLAAFVVTEIVGGIQRASARRAARTFGAEIAVGATDGIFSSSVGTGTNFASRQETQQITEDIQRVAQAMAAAAGGFVDGMRDVSIQVGKTGEFFQASVGGVVVGIYESLDLAIAAAVAASLSAVGSLEGVGANAQRVFGRMQEFVTEEALRIAAMMDGASFGPTSEAVQSFLDLAQKAASLTRDFGLDWSDFTALVGRELRTLQADALSLFGISASTGVRDIVAAFDEANAGRAQAVQLISQEAEQQRHLIASYEDALAAQAAYDEGLAAAAGGVDETLSQAADSTVALGGAAAELAGSASDAAAGILTVSQGIQSMEPSAEGASESFDRVGDSINAATIRALELGEAAEITQDDLDLARQGLEELAQGLQDLPAAISEAQLRLGVENAFASILRQYVELTGSQEAAVRLSRIEAAIKIESLRLQIQEMQLLNAERQILMQADLDFLERIGGEIQNLDPSRVGNRAQAESRRQARMTAQRELELLETREAGGDAAEALLQREREIEDQVRSITEALGAEAGARARELLLLEDQRRELDRVVEATRSALDITRSWAAILEQEVFGEFGSSLANLGRQARDDLAALGDALAEGAAPDQIFRLLREIEEGLPVEIANMLESAFAAAADDPEALAALQNQLTALLADLPSSLEAVRPLLEEALAGLAPLIAETAAAQMEAGLLATRGALSSLGGDLVQTIERYGGAAMITEEQRIALMRLEFQITKAQIVLRRQQLAEEIAALQALGAETAGLESTLAIVDELLASLMGFEPQWQDLIAGADGATSALGGVTQSLEDLGLAGEDLWNQQLSDAQRLIDFLAQQAGVTDPIGDIRREFAEFRDILNDPGTVAALEFLGLTAAEAAAALDQFEALRIQEAIDGFLAPWRDLLFDLRGGELSSRPGVDQVSALEDRFLDLAARAAGGDVDAARESAQVGRELIALANSVSPALGRRISDLVEGQGSLIEQLFPQAILNGGEGGPLEALGLIEGAVALQPSDLIASPVPGEDIAGYLFGTFLGSPVSPGAPSSPRSSGAREEIRQLHETIRRQEERRIRETRRRMKEETVRTRAVMRTAELAELADPRLSRTAPSSPRI